MIIWILELLFIIFLMMCLEEIGFGGACLFFAVVSVLCSIFATSITLAGVVAAFAYGLVLGAIAFIAAKLLLTLIDVLGSIGTVIIGVFFVIALIGLIIACF